MLSKIFIISVLIFLAPVDRPKIYEPLTSHQLFMTRNWIKLVWFNSVKFNIHRKYGITLLPNIDEFPSFDKID